MTKRMVIMLVTLAGLVFGGAIWLPGVQGENR